MLVTIRPDGTAAAGGWTASGAATLHAATSDNSDASYALSPTDFGRMRLAMTTVALAADERVKQYRVRARGRSDTLTSNLMVQLSLPGNLPNAVLTHQFGTTIETVTGPWAAATSLVTQTQIDVSQFWAERTTGSLSRGRAVEAYGDLDVRQVTQVTGLTVSDTLADLDRCGGANPSSQQVNVRWQAAYGYSGAPGTSLAVRHQSRIFTQAQTAFVGFDPWTVGPWGDPVSHVETVASQNQHGTAVTAGPQVHGPLPNGLYAVYVRSGTDDFQSQTGETWWSDTDTCQWTQNVPTPDPPAVACAAVQCPPSATVDVTHVGPGGTPWDDPTLVRTQVQVSWDGGSTWNDVVSPDNGGLVAEGATSTVADRFVSRHTSALYRARLYGFAGGAVAETGWTQCGPVQVGTCDCCGTWLIHPADAELDWGGTAADNPFSTGRPFAPAQSIVGGLPTVPSGLPSGRDHNLELVAVGTVDLLALHQTLTAALVWYVPDDVAMPAVWLAPGPSTQARSVKVADMWTVTVPSVQTGPQPVALPPAEPAP